MTTAALPLARSGIFGLLPTVVQVTAEAGIGFYFRCAGGTALWVTDRLCEYRKKIHKAQKNIIPKQFLLLSGLLYM